MRQVARARQRCYQALIRPMITRPSTKRTMAMLATVLSVGIVWIYSLHNLFSLPDVSHLRAVEPQETAYMAAYDGKAPIHHRWIPLTKISPFLQKAVVVAEDEQFYEHAGFDWEAIKQAAQRNWRRREFRYGASTITQQLARNLFLSPSKNPLRKLKELLIALKLERELSKDRIIELYLNVAEWGNGIYGADAAARHYFGIPASHLSPRQSAFLAAILPRPRFYDTHRNGAHLESRIASIERRI